MDEERDGQGAGAGTPAEAAGALNGLRVLDLSRVLAGPWAGQTLGDLGAEVIKVERPGTGDDTRAWGPPWLSADNESAYFHAANRNKRSLEIDLAQPEGQALVARLAGQCDVLIENFKVGGLAQYGLDYASLAARNPRLIYCSITGFGQTGPYAARPGYDFLIQGLGGLMSITGRPDDEPGGGPMKAGVAITDILTGLYATIAILAALNERQRSGLGQAIDCALLDVQVAALANQAISFLTTGREPVRLGNGHPSIVPYQDFPSADGHLILAVGNDAQFARLARALDAPEWATDERFARNSARVANRGALIEAIAERTRRRTTAEWITLLESVNVPCGPINGLAAVFADPQVRARGLQRQLDHPALGRVPAVASPLRLSRTPVNAHRASPRLGADTREVLARLLGLDEAELEMLARKGVIGSI